MRNYKRKQLSGMHYNSAVFNTFIYIMLGKISKFCVVLLLIVSIECCDPGEYSDSDKICRQCDISCNTCRSADGCATCYDQMYLVARGNRVLCDVCYNVNKGCDVCLTNNKCSNCSNGFYLRQDNTCAKCNSLVSNCLLCKTSNTTTYCISCSAPFRLVGSACINTTNSVSVQSSTDQGTNLPAASVQSPTVSNQNSNVNPPSNNANAQNNNDNSNKASNLNENSQSNTNTNPCSPNEILLKEKCYQSIAFCQMYDDNNGNCLSCTSIFVLSNGYCLPAALLTSQAAANQDTTPSTMIQRIVGSSSSAETSSSKCKDRQYSRNGQCVDVGAQCIDFDPTTGACYKCATNFDIYNGLCVQKDPSIQQVPSTNDNAPSSNSDLPSTSALAANCQFADPEHPNFCLVCLPNYTIVDQLPGVCIENN